MTEAAQFVTLGVGGELLAVPVERVQEILETRSASRLPHSPAYLLGVIDVRGCSVPVVDLRLKLGFEAREDNEDTRIIVLRVTVDDRDMTFGLKTDRVYEVAVLDAGELEPPPEIGVQWPSEAIAGIGRRNGAFVTVLNLGRLFAPSEIPMLEARGAAEGSADAA